ncbi:MAG: CBS domain-containing protein [Candidatus Bathyarchaeia archaeon]|nr:CBS domain-containing protein [Candidatus Bathyarchaeota archaeon]MDI9578345.1 CBS domain-containing protein [Thermoproteota archaeon]MDT8782587.1 CBS domain-containing protein [Candidatus Bathyarchaeota archaeon]NLD65473.1 CBS domain-containing protein [Thermoproteota archaeon]
MVSVKDVMTKDVVTVESGKTVVEAASVMAEKDLGCLVVVVKGFPVGIVTERDLVRRIVAVRGSFDVRVREVMSKTLVTIGPNVSLREAARVMASNRVRRLPVLDGNRLVGIIGASDFVRSVGRKTVAEELLSAVGRGSSSSV